MLSRKTLSRLHTSYFVSGMVFTVVLVCVLGISIYGLISIFRMQGEHEKEMVDIHAAMLASTEAQVIFKKQVQEWKNVLLRGQSTEMLNKYFKSFELQEAQLLDRLTALGDKRGLASETRVEIAAIIGQMKNLSAQYREALGKYDRSDPLSYARVDAMVRGIDREPTKRLDRLVVHISTEGEHVLSESKARMDQHSARVIGASVAAAVTGLALILMNLKRHWKREKDLEEARNDAEVAAQAKSAFIANMSHEVRTPLNGIMGMAQLMDHPDLSIEHRGYVNTLKLSCRNLLSIVNDILDFSKLEVNKVTLEKVEIETHSFLDGLTRLHHPRAKEKSIGLTFKIAENFPKRFESDQVRLNQILGNLIDNAVKFTEQGHVTVFAKRLEDRAESSFLEFSVSDTGKGISKKAISELFDPFTQEDVSTTRRHGGTGLGLSISSQLARLFGGELSVDSVVGKGSTFRFSIEFPIGHFVTDHAEEDKGSTPEASIANDNTPPNESSKSYEGIRLLVVEDNLVNQRVVTLLLRKLGIEPVIATNGQEAVDAQQEHKFDCILMDIQMPVMDGMEATRIIRESSRSAKEPWIIALTAGAMNGQRENALANGFNDFLSKPVDLSDLQESLDRAPTVVATV